MKIYKYSNGKMYSVEVRETEKMYIIDENNRVSDINSPFRYRERIGKNDYYISLSPIEGMKSEYNWLLERKGSFEDRLKQINAEIELLVSLMNSQSA